MAVVFLFLGFEFVLFIFVIRRFNSFFCNSLDPSVLRLQLFSTLFVLKFFFTLFSFLLLLLHHFNKSPAPFL